MNGFRETVNAVQDNVMSSVPSSQTILITGGSGFVAAHVLNSFLRRGYAVRTTVRSEESAEKVKQSHSQYLSKLSFAIVKDITADGAFDDAMKDVDGVIHTASPFVMVGITDNKKQFLDPAIKGTIGLLESVSKHAPKVKRVVITSSFAAMLDMSKGTWADHTYTEADWNPVTYEDAASASNPGVPYSASKTFAEKAAFNFVKHNKPHFTISTICPPMVYGPVEHNVESLDKLNTSSAEIYKLIDGSTNEVPPTIFWAFVDVRDVGDAHLKAFETPEAANERFYITAGNFSYQMICDIIRKDFPQLRERTPEGKPGSGLGQEVYKVDNSKSKKVLGMNYRPLETTIHDQVASFLQVEKKTRA